MLTIHRNTAGLAPLSEMDRSDHKRNHPRLADIAGGNLRRGDLFNAGKLVPAPEREDRS